jgi:amidophosphoribosyltransferase
MCGIYLFFSNSDKKLSELHNNLRLIQHRGQDSYGIFYKNAGNVILTNNKGKVENYEGKETTNLFMGHLRYTTSGIKGEDGTQPIFTNNKFGEFCFIYNGNIPCDEYSFLYNREYSLDTTLIRHFLEHESEKTNNWVELLEKFINTFTRGYSIIIYTKTDIYLIKDRYGVRPLCYSLSEDKNTFEAVSESVGVTIDNNITEINSGSVVQLKLGELDTPIERYNFLTNNKMRRDYGGKCIFEYIYFLSPDTIWDNVMSKKIREDWAEKLAKNDLKRNNFTKSSNEYLVIGIPSTGIQPGQAYAKYSNFEYSQAISKNKYINRTFILSKENRDIASKKKYIYDKSIISGKRVIIIDDSIVRGITMKNIVVRLKECGAKEVHIRIISPEIKNVCKYGIDIPTREELVATSMDNKQMNTYFDSNSLCFLNPTDMRNTMNSYIKETRFCSGCFDSNYGEMISYNDFIDSDNAKVNSTIRDTEKKNKLYNLSW